MSKLYLVRHAQVKLEAQVPAQDWNLSAEGVLSAQQLAREEGWDGVVAIWHSPERKAWATAVQIAAHTGLPLRMHEGLREVEFKTGILQPDQFQARVGAYFQGEEDPAFERYELAEARIVGAVREIVALSQDQDVVIVTHGRILMVLYSYLFGRRLGPEEWKSIGLPDLSVIDTKTWKVERGFLCNVSN
ncbi:histidine phosphatase family protein [Tumebacillus algifaecis]|uniref:histidine phosphatase family protein n=1 Tax=Tumebacillus algifaecis TaxID=1214604 RepID=UPI0012FDC440|nr:histidine phosphatase family protein [Tumebacillus algifaecis]